VLAVKAAAQVARGRAGFGMLLDDKYGREALFAAGHEDFWVGRPIELPGSRPLEFEFSQDIGSRLVEWPVDHCAKVLCFYHPDDDAALKAQQIEKLRTAYDAARRIGRDLLIEIIASKNGPVTEDTTARVLTELYDAGLKPDWWKLEPQQSAAGWTAVDAVIESRDPYCRGVMMLGLDAPMETLAAGFPIAKRSRTVRGFAVGRTIFGDAAKAWFGGTMSDDEAVADMATRFSALVDAWDAA
jgi:5-dehydro-2-deoxygluconokinase